MIEFDLFFNVDEVLDSKKVFEFESLGLTIDTRLKEFDKAFLCLSGPNFNSFEFVPELVKNNTPLIIFEENQKNTSLFEKYKQDLPDFNFIKVKNARNYLKKIATMHRISWGKLGAHKKLIGVVGSNGKTTNKEILFHILSNLYPGEVHKSVKSFNNDIGVPLTICGIKKDHNFVIVEIGTNHPGEIADLCQLARPNCGHITNIGASHLEFLGDLEGVFAEKRAIFDFIRDNYSESGLFLINMFDPFLSTLERGIHCELFDESNFKHIDGKFFLFCDEKKYPLNNKNFIGHHNFTNLAMACLFIKHLTSSKLEKIIEIGETFIPRDMRSTWINKQKSKIFMDAYNANPSSMEAALSAFFNYCQGKKVLVVLGEMKELGEKSALFHQKLGEFLKGRNAEFVFVGDFASDFEKGLGHSCHVFGSAAEVIRRKPKVISCDYDYIFIKGSRSLQLEKLLDIFP